MMTAREHLSEIRLSELGAGDASALCNGEAAHVAACHECAEKLALERELTAALSSLAAESRAPAGFASRARARYAKELRAKALRRAGALVAALVAGCTALILIGWGASDALAADLAGDVALGAVLVRTFGAIAQAAPTALAVGVAALASALLAAGGALFVLVRRSSEGARLSEARCKEV